MYQHIFKGAPFGNQNAAKGKKWGGSMGVTGLPHGTVLSVREGSGFNATSKNYLAHSDGSWHELGDTSMYRGTLRGAIKPDGNKIPDSKMAELGQSGAASIVREGGSRAGKIESAFDLEAMPAGTKLYTPAIHDHEQPTTTTKLPDGTWLSDQWRDPETMKQDPNTGRKTVTTMQISHWANSRDSTTKVLD